MLRKQDNFSCYFSEKYIKHLIVINKFNSMSAKEYFENLMEQHMYNEPVLEELSKTIDLDE
jgi:hypothetical protein